MQCLRHTLCAEQRFSYIELAPSFKSIVACRVFALHPAVLVVVLYTALYTFWDTVAGLTWGALIGTPLCILASLFQAQVRSLFAAQKEHLQLGHVRLCALW